MLHIIKTSPFSSSALENCLRYTNVNANAKSKSAILLIEDAVVAAVDNNRWQQALLSSPHDIYVLSDDVEARGIMAQVNSSFSMLDMVGFVALTAAHKTSLSW